MSSGINMRESRYLFGLLMGVVSLVLSYLLLRYAICLLSPRDELSSLARTQDSWMNKYGQRWKATEENLETGLSGISDKS